MEFAITIPADELPEHAEIMDLSPASEWRRIHNYYQLAKLDGLLYGLRYNVDFWEIIY
jgi:hypothetical protein